MAQGAGSSWISALAADSEKPSDASRKWLSPNVMVSVASFKFCVKSSLLDLAIGIWRPEFNDGRFH